MTREILFRGKSLESGKWVYGYFVKLKYYLDDKEMYFIIPEDSTLYPRGEVSVPILIDPETVGQWTGLVDKNGVKIFEGDVVRYKCTWSFPSDIDLETNVVESDRVMDVTEVVRYKNGEFTPRPRREDCEDFWYSYGYCDFEVIGNIHDNPELGGK